MTQFTLLPKKWEFIITLISADGSKKEPAFLQMNIEKHHEVNRDAFFMIPLLICRQEQSPALLFVLSLTYSLQRLHTPFSGHSPERGSRRPPVCRLG